MLPPLPKKYSQNKSETEQLKEEEQRPFQQTEGDAERHRKNTEAIRKAREEDEKKYGPTRRKKEYGR